MHVYICSDLTIIMSYKYEVNFEIDIIRGEAKEMNSDNAIEQKMCHKFVIGEKIDVHRNLPVPLISDTLFIMKGMWKRNGYMGQ